MENLTVDTICHIIRFLDLNSRAQLMRVSKTMLNLCRMDKIWNLDIQKKYPGYLKLKPEHIKSDEYYKRLEQLGDLDIMVKLIGKKFKVSDVWTFLVVKETAIILDLYGDLYLLELDNMKMDKIGSMIINVQVFKELVYVINSKYELLCLTNNKLLDQNVKEIQAINRSLCYLKWNGDLCVTFNGIEIRKIESRIRYFSNTYPIYFITYNNELKYARNVFELTETGYNCQINSVCVIKNGVSLIIKTVGDTEGIVIKTNNGLYYDID